MFAIILITFGAIWTLTNALRWAYNKGLEEGRRLRVEVHKIPKNVHNVKIVHRDEYDTPVEVFIYKANTAKLSGYEPVIIAE